MYNLTKKEGDGGKGPFWRYFVRGLFFSLPPAITIWVVSFAFGLVDAWLGPATDALVRLIVPESLLVGPFQDGHIPGLSFLLLVLLLVFVGAFASWTIGERLLRLLDSFIIKVPVVGAIYKGVRKIGDLFTGTKELPFQKVVILPFMGNGNYTLGFVTGSTINKADGRVYLRVAVPTPPNPVSCILVIVPEDRTEDAGMTVAEGLQFCMSLGMVGPGEMLFPGTTPPAGTADGDGHK